MSDRQIRKQRSRNEPENEAILETPVSTSGVSELDDLLDQIDEVLEENADEFVRNYVQKGGE